MSLSRFITIAILCLVAPLAAQNKPTEAAPRPTLADVQKLQVVNALQELEKAKKDVEIAQLKLQLLIGAVTPAGYQLTDKLELVKLPDPPKPPAEVEKGKAKP